MPEPNLSTPLNPAVDLRINGAAVSLEALTHLARLTVDLDNWLPGMFTLEMTAADDETNGTRWIDDQSLFALGNSVEIKLGYQGSLETVMTGEITGLEPEFAYDRLPSLIVRGYDRSHRLMRGRKTRTFVQQKDSEIVHQIAGEVGLTAQVQDSQVVHPYVLQANQTDLEFLQARARRIQYEVIVEDQTLNFEAVANRGGEVLTLTMGADILSFSPRLSSLSQISQVTVRAWNPKDKKEIEGKAQPGDVVSKMGGQNSGAAAIQSAFGEAVSLVSDQPVTSQAEADQLAKARLNRLALAYVVGEGICWGRTDVAPGMLVKIEGVGRRFSGQYYLTAISHRYSSQQAYETHFIARRNAA